MHARLFLVFITMFLPFAYALAEETSVHDDNKTWLERHTKAYYLNWLTGLHTEALSGNRDGSGTNFEDDHYLAFGPRFNKKTYLLLTLWGAQNFDGRAAGQDTVRPFQPGDPYLTFWRTGIWSSDRYGMNLDGYVRYYLPVSRASSDALNAGTVNDGGSGIARLYLSPSKTWLDGSLTFFGNFYAAYYIPVMTPDERLRRSTLQASADGSTTPASYRQNLYVILDPILDYAFNSKFDVYFEWASGKIRHYTKGEQTDSSGTHPVASRWSSIGHPTDGSYFSPGLNWSPTKKIFLNPYLSYQLSAVNDASAAKRRVSLFHCDIGLQMQYTFN